MAQVLVTWGLDRAGCGLPAQQCFRRTQLHLKFLVGIVSVRGESSVFFLSVCLVDLHQRCRTRLADKGTSLWLLLVECFVLAEAISSTDG